MHESFLPNVNEMRESLELAPSAAYGDLHLAAGRAHRSRLRQHSTPHPMAGRPDLRRPAPTSRPWARAVGSARSVRARVVLDDVADAGGVAATRDRRVERRSTSPSSSRPGRRSRRPSSPRARTRSSSSNCRIAPSSIASRSSSRTPAMERCSPASPQVCPSFAYPRDAISTTSRPESRRRARGSWSTPTMWVSSCSTASAACSAIPATELRRLQMSVPIAEHRGVEQALEVIDRAAHLTGEWAARSARSQTWRQHRACTRLSR